MTDARVNDNSRTVRQLAIEAAQLLADRHCEDVLLLDVTGLSHVCDFVLIGTGTSDRQMKSLAGELEELAASHHERVFRSNRDTGSTWIVIDLVDLVVHLFEPTQRAYYDLEDLWSDAEVVAWERPPGGPGDARKGGKSRVLRDSGDRGGSGGVSSSEDSAPT